MSGLDVVMMKWKSEVDAETIKLIEKGVPPYTANQQAVIIVSNRRANKNADQNER